MEEKPKEIRLQEGIHLLKQLRDAGVSETSSGFIELKEQISEWVKTGIRWEGRIEFPTYKRYADVVLPRKKSQTATIAFKVKKFGY
jgi:hypothetical protein